MTSRSILIMNYKRTGRSGINDRLTGQHNCRFHRSTLCFVGRLLGLICSVFQQIHAAYKNSYSNNTCKMQQWWTTCTTLLYVTGASVPYLRQCQSVVRVPDEDSHTFSSYLYHIHVPGTCSTNLIPPLLSTIAYLPNI